MNKKTMKIITAVVTFAMIMALSLSVFALSPNQISSNDQVNGITTITTFGQNLRGILTAVGVVVAVLILAVLGIKYMMGSASEKAEYKKTMIPYVVGAILLFGASTVANLVFEFANGL